MSADHLFGSREEKKYRVLSSGNNLMVLLALCLEGEQGPRGNSVLLFQCKLPPVSLFSYFILPMKGTFCGLDSQYSRLSCFVPDLMRVPDLLPSISWLPELNLRTTRGKTNNGDEGGKGIKRM